MQSGTTFYKPAKIKAMSVKFQLIDNKTGEAVTFHQLDEEICELINVDVQPRTWGGNEYNWYNIIGFKIAMGNALGSKELRDYVTDHSPEGWGLDWATKGKKVLDYLEKNYTSKAWA